MNQAILKFLPCSWWSSRKSNKKMTAKNLSEAQVNKEYIIKEVITKDPNVSDFLFTLGCFKGQSITLISILSDNYVITVKDARYSIDIDLAKTVILD